MILLEEFGSMEQIELIMPMRRMVLYITEQESLKDMLDEMDFK